MNWTLHLWASIISESSSQGPLFQFLRRLKTVISLGSNGPFSAGNHAITQGFVRQRARLKFANLATNMAARGFIRKTMFLPNLVSRLQYRLFLPLKISIPLAISNGKSFF